MHLANRIRVRQGRIFPASPHQHARGGGARWGECARCTNRFALPAALIGGRGHLCARAATIYSHIECALNQDTARSFAVKASALRALKIHFLSRPLSPDVVQFDNWGDDRGDERRLYTHFRVRGANVIITLLVHNRHTYLRFQSEYLFYSTNFCWCGLQGAKVYTKMRLVCAVFKIAQLEQLEF